MVNPTSSAVMKMRTVQPDGAAEGAAEPDW